MKEISVSLVILTWNRQRSVEGSLSVNIDSAGYPISELIHVDNGSRAGFPEWFKGRFFPTVQVLHSTNRGVAVGYNRGMALATGSHVVITGCDRVMPKNWLKTWVDCYRNIPETGVISCYTNAEKHNGRWKGEVEIRNGREIRQAIPVEARIHSKEFLFEAGFWREDFGTYGYEDAEWSDRARRAASRLGLINYVVPSLGLAEHLACDDFGESIDGLEYQAFKNKIHADPRRRALFKYCNKIGSPHYNPYARVEPNLLNTMVTE